MDSQDFETQEYRETSHYFTAQVDIEDTQEIPQHWGMFFIISNERYIKLKSDNVHFGRTFKNQNATDQYETLSKLDIVSEDVFQRVSGHHFTIYQLNHDETNGCPFDKMKPAFIVCKGQNGITVDDETLKKGEKKILKQNSILRLPFVKHKMFLFKYFWDMNDPSLMTNSLLLDEYLICNVIGKGSCGAVRMVISLKKMPAESKSKALALKSILYNASTVLSSKALNDVMNEVNIMKKLSYHHVLGLLNHFTAENKYLHLLFDLMGGGDLLNRIVDSPNRYLTETDAKFFFLQLLKGVDYLHSNQITHRDIKAENVFLSNKSPSPLLKIGDFGLAKISEAMSTTCGTFLYTAPEVFEKHTLYSQKVDIWSLGCLLYAMLSGKVPFPENGDDKMLAEKIRNAKYSLKGFEHVTLNSKKLIENMIQRNPDLRLNTTEIFKHPWLVDDRMNIKRLMKTYQDHGLSERQSRDELKIELQNLAIANHEHELFGRNIFNYNEMHFSKRPRLE